MGWRRESEDDGEGVEGYSTVVAGADGMEGNSRRNTDGSNRCSGNLPSAAGRGVGGTAYLTADLSDGTLSG